MPTHDPPFTNDLRDPQWSAGEEGAAPPRQQRAVPRGPLLVALAGALLGALFAALSTSDFMQHLDRQVHAIHCSFIPGAGKEIAESGCRTVMMSPYSSLFRDVLWGGIPISLWALAVFAFLAYRAGLLWWRGHATSGETKVLLAASVLPVAVSIVYGVLSVTKLDALCKVCVGIYAASAICFVGAWLASRAPAPYGEARFGSALVEGVGLVAALTVAYFLLVPRPDAKTSMLGCGSLVRADDGAGVMIPLVSNPKGAPSIEVLDPLCPSCKAFDQRLAASSLGERLDLKAVLFPLDSACNWMVTEAIHPGACAVSEAVLCAAGTESGARDADAARAVLAWAFARQAELRALAARNEGALRARIEQDFPAVKGCLGGALVRSKLTKSLRWAVANAIPVLTPQLFVHGGRMCDEDTDLGLEYTLTRMLSPEAEKERARRRALQPPRPQPAPSADLQAASPPPPVEVVPEPPAPAAVRIVEPAARSRPRVPEVAPSAPPPPVDLLHDEARPSPAPARLAPAAVAAGESPATAPAARDSATPPASSPSSDEETKR